MILIADGGSTKVDWAILDKNENPIKFQTLGLNPNISTKIELLEILHQSNEILKYKNNISEIYFYGAGCSTTQSQGILTSVFKEIFKTTKISVSEDTDGAVYASTKEESLVAIIGTGSNCCYFDGEKIHKNIASLGYIIMDDASGSYFGRQLIRDYFYKKMPEKFRADFKSKFNIDPNVIIENLYLHDRPNRYLATFAKFMADYKDTIYINQLVQKGFEDFFEYWIIPFSKDKTLPLYFVGSIAYFFSELLEKVANEHHLKIKGIIQKPIDSLITYHKDIMSLNSQ